MEFLKYLKNLKKNQVNTIDKEKIERIDIELKAIFYDETQLFKNSDPQFNETQLGGKKYKYTKLNESKSLRPATAEHFGCLDDFIGNRVLKKKLKCFEEEPELWKFEFENYDLLFKLYNEYKNSTYLIDKFLNFLEHYIMNKFENDNISYLPAEFFIRNDFNKFIKIFESCRYYSTINIAESLSLTIRHEPNFFDEEQLNKISKVLEHKDFFDDYSRSEKMNFLKDQIKKLQIKLLRNRFADKLPYEISRDEQKVTEMLEDQQYPRELKNIMNKIDYKIKNVKNNEEAAECLSYMRSSLISFLKETTKKIEIKKDVKFKDKNNERSRRDFLKKYGFITESEEKLLQGIYGFLSEEGSHGLTSNEKYLQIGRICLIELFYLLLLNSKKIF